MAAGRGSRRDVRGDVRAFVRNWSSRTETRRYHFRRGRPAHQVEFAFQNHWRVFSHLLERTRVERVLEVGSGRGSMGAFFADAGYDTHLLDISPEALRSAHRNFQIDGLGASGVNGDVLRLPYRDCSFDVVVSIGLLEHFTSVRQPLREQMRVLRPGGMMLGYVVPARSLSVQLLAVPVNAILKTVHQLYLLLSGRLQDGVSVKSPLYRSAFGSREYLRVLGEDGVQEMGAFGMFPLPLVSHSPEFPFTPMPPFLEGMLVTLWKGIVGVRVALLRRDPWICSERWGLAFLVWARKLGGSA